MYGIKRREKFSTHTCAKQPCRKPPCGEPCLVTGTSAVSMSARKFERYAIWAAEQPPAELGLHPSPIIAPACHASERELLMKSGVAMYGSSSGAI